MAKSSKKGGSSGSNGKRQKTAAVQAASRARLPAALWIGLVLVAGIVTGAIWMRFAKPAQEKYTPRPKGTVSFNKQIAPIVFNNCATCHRPGQSGPFPLIHYADAKKHAQQMAEVTQSRYMPPWLPQAGDFLGERRLTVDQIGLIQQWAAEGAVEGASEDLPAEPKWRDGWQLGTPDLVVTMPEAYTLPAAGKDIYRNFVVPIPTSETRYVKAIEFSPGNRCVHHSFFLFDRTHRARQKQRVDNEPGFPGMSLPEGASSPQGTFLSWQPGHLPSMNEDLAWTLEKDTDLLLQVHMQPTGKPESVRCSMAFYFTDKPSSRTMIKIGLSDLSIDIPAGAQNHIVEDTFVLPVDADVLALMPHAHYLGKELRGFATLPDGTKKTLLDIKQWDFNWQNDYRFKTPVSLPKGSAITMQFSYDNSTNNVRNPNHPPKPVQYGIQTTDEMAELWMQLQLRGSEDLPAVEQALAAKIAKQNIAYNQYRLRLDPNDAEAHSHLGELYSYAGRKAEALEHLEKAIRLNPNYDEPHYHLGLIFRVDKQLDRAREEFEMAIRLNPQNSKAHGNLGFIFASVGDLEAAEQHLRMAIQINPNDTLALKLLNQIAAGRK